MINVTSPFVRTIVEYSIKFAMRVQLLFCHCGSLSAPEGYNIAWRTPQVRILRGMWTAAGPAAGCAVTSIFLGCTQSHK